MEKTLQQEENSSGSANPGDTDHWRLVEDFEEAWLSCSYPLPQASAIGHCPSAGWSGPVCLFLYMESIFYK